MEVSCKSRQTTRRPCVRRRDAVWAALFLTACTVRIGFDGNAVSWPPGRCVVSADCPFDLVCNNGQCEVGGTQSCVTNADCPEACITGVCASFSGRNGPCDDTADCVAAHTCRAGQCKADDLQPCSANGDCLGTCINGVCGPLSDSAGACDDGADCAVGLACLALTCLAPDPDLSVTTAGMQINTYAAVIDSALAPGATAIAVDSSAGFAAGDELMLVQMQDSGFPERAGRFEFITLASATSGTLTLGTPLKYAYASNAFDAVAARVAQLVRVPHYRNVDIALGASITCLAWDGHRGGIVALRASGALTIAGAMDVSGKGFRGGTPSPPSAPNYGNAGESTTGHGGPLGFANHGGGGGGSASDTAGCPQGGGGGGGGYGTVGTRGTHSASLVNSGARGLTVGANNLRRLLPGSGGGAAANFWDGSGVAEVAGAGGAGGGAIYVTAATLSLGGTLSAAGADGQSVVSTLNAGGGGGGSGGAIFMSADNAVGMDSLRMSVVGGAGGLGGAGVPGGGDGGAGGLGALKLAGPPPTDLVLAAARQVLNDYGAVVDASLPAGTTLVQLEDATGFAANDDVLVVQMQDPLGVAAGTFEWAIVQSIAGSTLTLAAGLT